MERRFILAALTVLIAAATPAGASAATAPSAPQLTSAQYVSPAVFTWTPGADLLNVQQTVYRAPGACTTPPAAGQLVATYPGNATTQHFAVPGDGTFCFFVRATDLALGTADSSGLTLTIDTTPPTSTIAVAPTATGGIVSGVVNITRTAADATSGVASNLRRIGPVGGCGANSSNVPARWDTTAYTDGDYDVCNVVTDRAGYTTIATLRITVANTVPVPVPIPSPVAPPAPAPAPAGSPAPVVSAPVIVAPAGTVITDKIAPGAPTKLAVIQPRSKSSKSLIPLTLRWVNPKADDLDHVVVVLNLKHQPRSRTDGTVVYSGLRASAPFKLKAGTAGYLALFAFDRTGNISSPARRTVSLASLIPLRPLTGSKVESAPRLTWKAKDGTAYYNVQVFRDGKRVLTDWPAQASLRLPANLLEPGTYTWFVWPALKGKGSGATFGELIGRATFVYEG